MKSSTLNLTVKNPYNLEVIARVPTVGWDVIDEQLEQAVQVYHQGPLPAHQRIAILEKVASLIKRDQEELTLLIAQEGGKPVIDAKAEVTRAIDSVSLAAKELLNLKGQQIPMDLTLSGMNRIAFTQPEPIGPVVAISAFNHPLNLIAHQVAPAVAVGCPILVKPSSSTPLSCQRFVHYLYEAGLPKAWCRFIPCSSTVAERLAGDPRIAFLSFIGSAEVGWKLKSQLAPGTRCALEHGGSAPVIIDSSADISQLIPLIIKGGFYHSGQVCVSVQRVFVEESQAQDVAQRLSIAASELSTGDPTKPNTDCGPLISPQEVDRVNQWVQEAIAEGAQVMTGGKPLGATTYAPTVLYNPSLSSKVSQQEVFGPVICIYSYTDIEEAIQEANALPYAFQASVFSQDLNRALYCVKKLDAAAVMINDHTAFRVDWMPFAGHRYSGYGTGGILYTMQDMTQEKLTIIKTPS